MPLNIAMDGPAGAGKSTVADAVAARLGMLHLDTGAMYRAFALDLIRKGVDPADAEAAKAMLPQMDVGVSYAGGKQVTLLQGEDVSALIRTPEVSAGASAVAKIPEVRRAMVALQQKLASEQSMLVDGRDICLRVLPDADLKIFLTASAEERAMRRFRELQAKGAPDTYEQVLADLVARDKQDSERAADPLRPTEDAVIVDTTGMPFEAVVDKIVALAEEVQCHE